MNRSRIIPGRLLAALLALLAATGAAVGARAQVSPEAAPLVERHVASLGGWPALDALQDLTLEGTIEVAGLKGPLSLRLRHDGRQWQSVNLKVYRAIEALDGADAWEQNASGQVEGMGLEKAAAMRRSLDRAFSRHLRGDGVAVSLQPDETRDGQAWAVLRFAYADGDAYDVLVDEESGDSTWSRETTAGREQWTRTTDVREVGGLKLAFRQEVLDANPLQNQVVTWQSIAANTGLADDLFRRPGAQAAPRLFRLAGEAATTDWIPLELHMERWIYLQGTVNGAPTEIVLDSGAGITVLDQATADGLGLRSVGELPAQGVGGTTKAGLVEGITIGIGGLTLGPVTAATIDLAGIAARLDRGMPVILGKEVFHALVVDVDYPNQRLRFLDPSRFTYEGPGRRLAVMPGRDGHKLLKMNVEGLPEAVFSLDTGQGNALTLFRRFADDNRLLEGRRSSTAMGGGVGGRLETTLATLATVTLAGFEFRDVPASFHRTDVGGAFDSTQLAGNLGAGILSRFRVVFDYARECLWLEPGARLAEPLERDRLGLGVRREGEALVVEHVAPGSPAAAAGWQPGARITAVDGVPVTAKWWRRWAALQRAGDGVRVRLAVDGQVRELVLKAFY